MRFLLYILSGTVLLMLAGLVAIFLVVAKYGSDLPDYRQLANYEPKIVTRIHAGDGRLLAEFAAEKRIFVPVDAIPKRVINAFLAAEDKDFYKHGGIDPVRIAKAAFTDLRRMHSDRRPGGASTITQQVAKNFLLTNEVSFSRKIKEAILAFRIEETFSKQRILELYLNQIYLGQGTYGVAAAALNYFDKPLDELTVAEAAFLGELPKAPNNFNPDRRNDAALERRNWVIGRMAEDGFISREEADEAIATPLAIHHARATEFVNANYFTEEVRKQLAEMYGDNGLYGGGLSVRTTLDPKLQGIAVTSFRDGIVAYDQRHGWRGPLTRIAMNPGWEKKFAAYNPPDGAEPWRKALVIDAGKSATLQLANGSRVVLGAQGFTWTHKARASDLMAAGDIVLVEDVPDPPAETKKPAKGKKGMAADAPPSTPANDNAPATATHLALRQMPAVSGGLIAMDPHTGRVLAMVGGLSTSINEFNRATQAKRQPGSSFKPFVYTAALDKGFTPSTLVEDAPIALSQGPGLPMWRPVNYEHDFLGAQPLRVAIEKSRNAMTVRVAEYIGMPIIADYAKKFGVMDNMPLNYSMALGAGETTVMRMVTGYSMLVNGGKRIVPTLIDRVQDRNGKTLYRHDARACAECMNVDWDPSQAVPSPAGTQEQVEDPRTAYQMVNIMQGVVQRGTGKALSKLDRNLAGKTGTTNDSKDVWFIGFTPDLAMGVYVGFDKPVSLGRHETGATTAVPIFGAFMKSALDGQPDIPFRRPPGIRIVRVNPATGQPDFGPGSIEEAFVPGNEPGEDNFVVNGSSLAAKLNERGEPDTEEKDTPGAVVTNAVAGDAASDEDSEGDMGGDAQAAPAPANGNASGDSYPAIENPAAVAAPVPTSPVAPPSATEGTGGLY